MEAPRHNLNDDAGELIRRERRCDPRVPAGIPIAMTTADGRRQSAWMLNMSVGGAAFCARAAGAPSPGDAIELELALDVEPPRAGLPPIAGCARVLRVEELFDEMCRVAVRYEANIDTPAWPGLSDTLIAAATMPARTVAGGKSRSARARPAFQFASSTSRSQTDIPHSQNS